MPTTKTKTAADALSITGAPGTVPTEEADEALNVGPPQGVDLTGKKLAMQQERFAPQSPDKEFLTGPSEEPWHHVGRDVASSKPKDAQRWLPDLLEAAQDPNAPEELLALVRLISSTLEDD